MTKRKLLAIFFALAMVVSLTACGNQSESAEKSETVVHAQSTTSPELEKLVLIESGSFEGTIFNWHILYDSDTMVMYSIISCGDGIGMTRLDNPDGTPKLYSPDSKTE